jgi:hypothetical protein
MRRSNCVDHIEMMMERQVWCIIPFVANYRRRHRCLLSSTSCRSCHRCFTVGSPSAYLPGLVPVCICVVRGTATADDDGCDGDDDDDNDDRRSRSVRAVQASPSAIWTWGSGVGFGEEGFVDDSAVVVDTPPSKACRQHERVKSKLVSPVSPGVQSTGKHIC